MSTSPQLVIFDCDGVLIDSEILAAKVLSEMLTTFGFPTQLEEINRYFGLSWTAIATDVETRFQKKLPPDFSIKKVANERKIFEEALQATPGIHSVLDVLANEGTQFCVASSSSPERLHHTLGLTGLWDRLAPHIFSTVQVKKGKPAPDLFLFAAAQMKIPPSRCVVVEDSLAGVQAGKTAGMTVYGFAGGSHCPEDHTDKLRQQGADAVYTSMEEISFMVGGKRNSLPQGAGSHPRSHS